MVGLARQVQRPQACLWSGLLDLSMGQLKAVFALTGEGPLSVGTWRTCWRSQNRRPAYCVDRLQDAELALRERDPADKRKTRVVPTAKATALSERLLQVKEERLGQWLDCLSDDELRGLLRGLTALVAAASAAGSAAAPGEHAASATAAPATPAPASPQAARNAVRT